MLACLYAPTPEAQYPGLLFAHRQVLYALLKIEPDDAIQISKRRHPGVQRDINAHRAFWMGHRGALTDVGSAFNDTYLKLNGVKGGTDSYRESLILIATLFESPRLETRTRLLVERQRHGTAHQLTDQQRLIPVFVAQCHGGASGVFHHTAPLETTVAKL